MPCASLIDDVFLMAANCCYPLSDLSIAIATQRQSQLAIKREGEGPQIFVVKSDGAVSAASVTVRID